MVVVCILDNLGKNNRIKIALGHFLKGPQRKVNFVNQHFLPNSFGFIHKRNHWKIENSILRFNYASDKKICNYELFKQKGSKIMCYGPFVRYCSGKISWNFSDRFIENWRSWVFCRKAFRDANDSSSKLSLASIFNELIWETSEVFLERWGAGASLEAFSTLNFPLCFLYCICGPCFKWNQWCLAVLWWFMFQNCCVNPSRKTMVIGKGDGLIVSKIRDELPSFWKILH